MPSWHPADLKSEDSVESWKKDIGPYIISARFIHECASGNLIKLPLYLYIVPTSYQNNYSLHVIIVLIIP